MLQCVYSVFVDKVIFDTKLCRNQLFLEFTVHACHSMSLKIIYMCICNYSMNLHVYVHACVARICTCMCMCCTYMYMHVWLGYISNVLCQCFP